MAGDALAGQCLSAVITRQRTIICDGPRHLRAGERGSQEEVHHTWEGDASCGTALVANVLFFGRATFGYYFCDSNQSSAYLHPRLTRLRMGCYRPKDDP
jgi:hypothetical protein